jgi:hypothetical protein
MLFSEQLLELSNTVQDRSSLVQPKCVIYTSIVGDSDVLLDPDVIEDDVEFFCFTDNKKIKSSVWQIIHVDFQYRDPRRLAKIFKVLPHKIFKSQKYSIWIDGNVKIISPITGLLNDKSFNNNGFAFFKHPSRNCAYDEAKVCLKWGRDHKELITKQMLQYKEEGFPRECGLIWGGVIFREHHKVKNLMEAWWNEIERFSVRDQLSFNYCTYKLGVVPLFFDSNDVRKYFVRSMHKKSNLSGLNWNERIRALASRLIILKSYLFRRKL